jgi:formyl-CoA transferase
MENELFLAPVSDAGDLLENPQLKSREFWVKLEHPELEDAFIYPGPFVKMSETPVTVRRRAPLIGEHNNEVYRDEMGISVKELVTLKQAGII